MVRLLVSAGADKDKASQRGNTSLMGAAKNGRIEIVLLSAGAEKDKVDTDGNTALSIATEKGHQEIVQMLQLAGPRTGASVEIQKF